MFVNSADWTTTAPFVSPLNFLDPLLTSNASSYCQERYKELTRGRYLISKHCNTSYNDVGKISPLERDYIIGFITDELKKQQEAIDEAKNKK